MHRAAFALTVLTAAAITACAGAAVAQDRPPAYTNAEACLEANVAAAVAASSGATDAAHFLLDFLCAEQVSYARAYQRNSAALEGVKTMMSGVFEQAESTAEAAPVDPADIDAEPEYWIDRGSEVEDFTRIFAGIRVDPVTGAIIVAPEIDDAMGQAVASVITNQMAQLGPMADEDVPVFLRQLAGRLVMAHRRR